jgi:hypothetical protein
MMVNDVKYKCHKHPKIVADCTTHRVFGVLLPCADGVDLEGIDGNPKFVVCSSSWGTFIHSLDTHLRQSHIASETPLFFSCQIAGALRVLESFVWTQVVVFSIDDPDASRNDDGHQVTLHSLHPNILQAMLKPH